MPLDRVEIDNICDYIPFVSSYTNIVDLVQKKRFKKEEEEFKQEPPLLKSKYVTHIVNKPDIRCAVLIIPIIGNAIVGIYDLFKALSSIFGKEEEEKTLEIGRPSNFKHVSSGAAPATKKVEDEPEDDLEERIDEKIKANKQKEFEEESAGHNANDIYANPPAKLEHIPAREQRAYLKSLGFTEGFYASSDHYAEKLLGNLSRNMAPNDEIRKQLNDPSVETEYVKHLRELPAEKVMELIKSISTADQRSVLFREKFLMFLMLDPRLKFDTFINDNLSDLATLMIEADKSLKDRLNPLIKNT